MATRLVAPSMGEGIVELTVVKWLKKEGDPVQEFEAIVEMETDKVTTEIPSPATGTVLKILACQDEIVKVGSPLAWIGQPGEALEPANPTVGGVGVSANTNPIGMAKKPASEESIYTGWVSPLVKKLVDANQIDLNQVHGTGQGGRITKDDILNYLETRKTTSTPAIGQTPDGSGALNSALDEKSGSPLSELIPHTSMRKKIAERMVFSKHTSPHVMTVMEADLSKVLAHKASHKVVFASQGVNLTLTAYFCAGIVRGLKACPEVNSCWTEEGIRRYRSINLGIATALGDEGLIVPVIKDADLLSLQGLAQKINDLSSRARLSKLLPEEVKGGTFTLSNHGTGGSLFASPIIVQPQAAILGVGRMQKRVVVVTDTAGNDAIGNDAIAIRPMVYLSLVFDHRTMDGESADRFLSAVKDVLEAWE